MRALAAAASLAVLLTALLAAHPASAQVRFTDSEGITHWVSTPEEVPEQYRGKATGHAIPPRPPGSAPSVNWEQRARELQQEQDRRLREIEQQDAMDSAARQARDAAQHAADEQYSQAAAQQHAAGQAQGRWSEAAAACRAQVQDQSWGAYAPAFDAFVSGYGQVKMVGSAQQRFAYAKCMRDAGFALE